MALTEAKIKALKPVARTATLLRFHIAPYTAACIFWLKNRKKDEWRDRQNVEHS